MSLPISEIHPLTTYADALLHEANGTLDKKRKSAMGQFMTPATVSNFMASLFNDVSGSIRVLDAGAGIGSLTAAFVERCCMAAKPPASIDSIVFELEPAMIPSLHKMLETCLMSCVQADIAFSKRLYQEDFISAGIAGVEETLFSSRSLASGFSHAILNPPYKKINSSGTYRLLLRSIGIETVNLYAAFVALAVKMLQPGGELVAITPRSFCNGPYFKPFRRFLLNSVAITRIHLFESRDTAFAHDDVLQENIIFHCIKGTPQGKVVISSTEQTDFSEMSVRFADFSEIVKPADPDMVIHITANGGAAVEAEQYVTRQPCTLPDLGIEVSTGPVVDFRLREYLHMEPKGGALPLIYSVHCENGFVRWPVVGRKPNAIIDAEATAKWLMPNGWYTLIRRFSSKEEKRRIVATVHDPARIPGDRIGFENHLNLFHSGKKGLSPNLAKGLALYLNSSPVDEYFRQFSGHTQVNASDLRMLRYPLRSQLESWGNMILDCFPSQDEIDAIVKGDLTSEYETTKAA